MNAVQSPRVWMGIGAACVGAIVLTSFASVAPAGVRKLVLFAVAFGIGIGWMTGEVARRFGLSRGLAQFGAPLLVIAGLCVVAVRIHGEYQFLQRAENRAHPERSSPPPLLEAIAASDPQTAQMLRREELAAEPGFLDYLAVRTRPLAEWDRPWPLVFWIGELLLAGLVGLVVVRRMLPGDRSSEASMAVDTDSV